MRFNVLFCIDFLCLVNWAFLAKQTEAHASRSLISPIVRCITAANIGNHPVCNGCPACHAPLEPVVPCRLLKQQRYRYRLITRSADHISRGKLFIQTQNRLSSANQRWINRHSHLPNFAYISIIYAINGRLHDRNQPKNTTIGHPLLFPVSDQTRISRLWLWPALSQSE
ncbi:MAG: hypothetical protein RIQ83_3093 [Pseudomonadota bacterium]